jgi:hypothetical protein
VTVQTREMTDSTSGTCDWGRCDEETAAERWDPDSGDWLGVCTRHGARPTRPSRPKAERGACPVCGTDRALTTAGTVRFHRDSRIGWNRCPGSGKPPREEPTK